ncbi:hypothetical protein MM221_19435 [Salipaludibacillus sp. LMS25]|uniref:hypothetical protein n=1 Tax=Salipaludibacillus sp. LMS25 TaxID=2924031 RepID=UPI0020D120BD|nr:hypothetical protein [Salipaludibacillus sp. LMS25]UTR14690.1 hypothetical protein MM221_19435 [Salipaludibacillus sp. LMS25]
MKKWIGLGVMSVVMVSVWGVLLSFMFSHDNNSASSSEPQTMDANESLNMPSYGVNEDDVVSVEETENDKVTAADNNDELDDEGTNKDEWDFSGKSVSVADITIREGDAIGYGEGVSIDELLEGFSISE